MMKPNLFHLEQIVMIDIGWLLQNDGLHTKECW